MAYDPDEDESEYMKDIIGYDGDFNQKAKIWTKSFISEIKPEETNSRTIMQSNRTKITFYAKLNQHSILIQCLATS